MNILADRHTYNRGAVLGAWILLMLAAAAPAEDAPAPRVACDEPVYRFGTMENIEDVIHTFTLTNTGTLTLQIESVRTDCGCTLARPAGDRIRPGQTLSVETKLILKGRVGKQRKRVILKTNDPLTPNLELVMEGEAVASIVAQPDRMYLGILPVDAAVTQSLDVVATSNATFHITGIASSLSPYDVRYETVTAGRSYRLYAISRPPLPLGAIHGTITVNTDHPKYAAFPIPLAGRVVDELYATPEEIVLEQPNAKPAARLIIIRSVSEREFHLLSVEPPAPEIQVSTRMMDPARYRIDLRNLVPSESLNGKTVRITTDLKTMKELLIPIRVVKPAEPEEPEIPLPSSP